MRPRALCSPPGVAVRNTTAVNLPTRLVPRLLRVADDLYLVPWYIYTIAGDRSE